MNCEGLLNGLMRGFVEELILNLSFGIEKLPVISVYVNLKQVLASSYPQKIILAGVLIVVGFGYEKT